MELGRKLGLAVLISGSGSNLQALIDACGNQEFPARIELVICNVESAYGIERAKQAGIPAAVIPHKNYPSREAFEQAMLDILGQYPIDLICQAGFIRILTPHFLAPWAGRIINIHPSLLPMGKGAHGQKVHRQILDSGARESGCTVHYVTENVDEGEIILQRAVPVLPDDTTETLATRVLEQEHIAYPDAVRLLANSSFYTEN